MRGEEPCGCLPRALQGRAATAAQGSRSRRLTDAVPAWFSGGCSAFSSAITPFLETSSPASLPVPPAPARGRSASPTTRRTGFRLRGGAGVPGVGPAAQCEACSLPRSRSASNAGHPLPSPPLTRGHRRGAWQGRRGAWQGKRWPVISLPREFCLEAREGGKLTPGPPALTSPGRGWGRQPGLLLSKGLRPRL